MGTPRALACAFAVTITVASGALARPLLSPVRHGRAAVPRDDAGRVERLAIDLGALAELRASASAVVRRFPLGRSRRVTLELARIDPFGPGSRLVDVVGKGEEALRAPDRVWLVGTVRGDPESRALLVAAPGHVHGFVATGGEVFPFAPDGAGLHRIGALTTAHPTELRAPDDFCLQDVYGAALEAMRPKAHPRVASSTAAQSAALRELELAIDTDQEFLGKFPTQAAALEYLGTLVAAASLIYERDAGVRLRASFVRLWSTTDPWQDSSPLGTLLEVQRYWTNPANGMDALAGQRDAVQFVSGKAIVGGVAWIGSVCDPAFGFAVSQVAGHFDTTQPQQIWDVLVFAHELGHVLGSPHTHCYDPPVDRCFSGEQGCYVGPLETSPSGTIMSYCHLLPGGLANVSLLFGGRPSEVLRAAAARASCLAPVPDTEPVCGNGVREGPETCDDGNSEDGDGCSASCGREPRCGDGIVDPGEACDDGNGEDGDGCSATCGREPRCGDGIVDAGEACDDGNPEDGDGCSSRCASEACAIVVPHQTAWLPARLRWRRSGQGDRFRLHARFGVPRLAPRAAESVGFSLTVHAADGRERLAIALPADAGWRAAPRERRWQSPLSQGAAAVRVRELGGDEGVQQLELRVTAGGQWAFGPGDLPVAVSVVLGGESEGHAGLCGRYTFSRTTCRVPNDRRILCR